MLGIPVELFGKAVTEEVIQKTDCETKDEQGGCRGRGYIDQIIWLVKLHEKYQWKGRHRSLEKA